MPSQKTYFISLWLMKVCTWALSPVCLLLFPEVWGCWRDSHNLQGLQWILIMQLLFKLWINSCLKRMRHLCWLCVLANLCYDRPQEGMIAACWGLLLHVSSLSSLLQFSFLSFLSSNLNPFFPNSPLTYKSIMVVDAFEQGCPNSVLEGRVSCRV